MIVSYNNSPNQQQENWSPRSLAQLIAKRSRGGDDVKCLIDASPIALNSDEVDDQSCTVQVQSPTKKPVINHIQANRQALREKQQNNRNAQAERHRKEKLKQENIEKKKQKLYGNVRSRVSMSISSSSNSIDDCCHSIDAPIQSRVISPFSPAATDSVSSENSDFHIAFGRKVPIHVESRPISGSRPITDVDSVVSSSSSRHKSYGKVPRYITQRKERITQAEQDRARKEELEPPEPGLVLLAESERLKTLALLEINEKTVKYNLVNIPFSMNPKRAGRLREALSLRLKEI